MAKNNSARGKSNNTFRQGLNTDMHPLDTSNQVMTDNSNATLLTSEGDEYILQNMPGNELITSLTEGFKPVAVKVFNNIAYIISQNIADPSIGEIGTFPSPDWPQLNKQIPTLKDKMVTTSITDTLVQPIIVLPSTMTRTKATVSQFQGQWKTANQIANPGPGDEGCFVCKWRFKMNDGTYFGSYNPGETFNFSQTYVGDEASNNGIAQQELIKAHFSFDCDCNDPSLDYSEGSLDWILYSLGGTIVNTQTDTITYTYVITSVTNYTGAHIEIDFTGSGVQGVLQASSSNGILNSTSGSVDEPAVDGLVIDGSTGIVKFNVINFSGFPTFTIVSNVNHAANDVSVQTITGWRLGPESTEYIKTYDIVGLGLTGTQLAQASFSLYHTNNYILPDSVAADIQWKVESTPAGAAPTTYLEISLPPGAEIPLGITSVTAADTLDLYILYPGTGVGGPDFPLNYELYITYPSEEGEICVPMSDVYAPLHNFYDYNGAYYDSTALPVPPNPPTAASLDEEGYYVAPLQTNSFNFENVDFIDIELQPAYDRSINIIFTDDKNKPKLVNSRFIVKAGNKEATIADRQGVRDTNVYSNERWGNTDLILTADTIAKMSFIGFDDGGNLLPGGYRFYFIYSNSDLQTSAIFSESRLVQVTKSDGSKTQGAKPDDRVGKTIHFQFEDLDNKFLFVKIFFARDMGEFNAGAYELREVFNLYPINTDGTLDIRFTGFELTIERASNYLETAFTDISTAHTLTAIQGSLAVANTGISLEHLDYLRVLSSNLHIEEETASMATLDVNDSSKTRLEKRLPYLDADNVYHNLGMWSGETYEIGVVYKMTESNLLSPVIPIRGLDNFLGGEVYTGTGVITGAGFDEGDDKRENTNGVYRTQEAKTTMDGSTGTPNNPNITYLNVNMNPVVNDAFMQEITSGFFIVRKQRLKDCQYEGMLGAAMAVPLAEPIANTSTFRMFGISGGIGSMDTAAGNFVCGEDGLNAQADVLRQDQPARYLPWMGSMGSTAIPQYESTTANPKYQGGVLMFTNIPYDEPGTVIPSANDVWSHFSFYTPEIVTSPTDVASFFSGTARGLRYAAQPTFINSANGSAFGSFRTLKASLFQSTYKNISGRNGILSTAGMQDYVTNPLRWNYITAGQDTVTPESFSAIARGYEYMGNLSTAPLANGYGWQIETATDDANGQGINGGTGPQSAGRFNFRFDDFAGLTVEGGDIGDLKARMQHVTPLKGEITVDNPPANFQFDKDEFYDAMENNEVNMGVLCRIFPTSAGPLNRGDQWQAKYQSTTTTGYYAVTDRYSWGRFTDELPSGDLNIFDGDCYVGEHYKRMSYKLGIQDNPAATDGSIYKDEAAALFPAGMIMSMVLHSSQNFAIRTEEFKSASELTIYGTDRSFYPLYTTNEIRDKQQIDSKLFYAGYDLQAAASTHARQTVELPAILQSFPFRVLLSAPADLTSFTNGYRDFSEINFRDYDSAFGQISKIVALQSQLYVIWEYGIGSIFTSEKTMVTDEDGGVYVDQASRLHPQSKVISNKYGTTDPYSVITTADAIYGIDWSNNKVWRVSAAGQFEIISDFKVERVLTKVKEDLQNNNTVHKFYAGYDTYKRNVYFNYSGYNNGDPTPIGSIYYNEILKIWISKLTFYPYFIFNIRENWYSYNFDDLEPTTAGQIWQHNSDNADFCNFYGTQHPFEYEFILVDNPAAQKILNNLKIISTEEYPLTATYSIIDKHDYETGHLKEASFVDRLIKRYKQITAVMNPVDINSPYLIFQTNPNMLAGEHIQVDHGGTLYEVQDVYEYLDLFYVYVVYQNPITKEIVNGVGQAYTGEEHVTINNGIIKENILYKEDHFYIVVGNRFIYVTQDGQVGESLDELPSTPLPNTLAVSPFEASKEDDLALVNFLGIDPKSELDAIQLAGFGIHFPGLDSSNVIGVLGDEVNPLGEDPSAETGFYGPGTPNRVIAQGQLGAPRDKYIRIKLRYTGDRQVFIQAVETMFTYSFS